jgi:hypothetical protein
VATSADPDDGVMEILLSLLWCLGLGLGGAGVLLLIAGVVLAVVDTEAAA